MYGGEDAATDLTLAVVIGGTLWLVVRLACRALRNRRTHGTKAHPRAAGRGARGGGARAATRGRTKRVRGSRTRLVSTDEPMDEAIDEMGEGAEEEEADEAPELDYVEELPASPPMLWKPAQAETARNTEPETRTRPKADEKVAALAAPPALQPRPPPSQPESEEEQRAIKVASVLD